MTADEAADVRRVWSGLGLPGIVDVHTHFMPKPVMDKVWKYFDSQGPLIGRPWPIRYCSEERTRVETLRDFGVRAFTSLVYPHKPQMAAWLNQWAIEFARHTTDCLATATSFPNRTPRPMLRQRSATAPVSSRFISRWATSTRTILCWIMFGA